MSLLAAFRSHEDLPLELVELCGTDQFFERNLCRIADDIRWSFRNPNAAADASGVYPETSGRGEYASFIVRYTTPPADIDLRDEEIRTIVDSLYRTNLEGSPDLTNADERKVRIRTELFRSTESEIITRRKRIMKMTHSALFKRLDSTAINGVLNAVVRQSYVEYGSTADGFYYDIELERFEYHMRSDRTDPTSTGSNDCRWTPLLLHLNDKVDIEWSLNAFWNTCIARTMSKRALVPRNDAIIRAVKAMTDLPFEQSIVIDLLPFTESGEIPGGAARPATGWTVAELQPLLRDSSRFKEWGDKRPLKHPDLNGIRPDDLDELWSRAMHDDTAEHTVEANETLMLIEDAIKEYLYQTPPYQVAATVAGFNSSQVAQLYYERVFTDVVNVFMGSNATTRDKKKGPVSPEGPEGPEAPRKRRKVTFDSITETLSPDELRSGMVPQKKIYALLRALFRTPEWRARIHWRPNLHSHYFDVLQFVKQRLVATGGNADIVSHLDGEITQRSTVLYGVKLFRSRCAEIDADIEGRGALADDWRRGRDHVSFLGAEQALERAKDRLETAKAEEMRAANRLKLYGINPISSNLTPIRLPVPTVPEPTPEETQIATDELARIEKIVADSRQNGTINTTTEARARAAQTNPIVQTTTADFEKWRAYKESLKAYNDALANTRAYTVASEAVKTAAEAAKAAAAKAEAAKALRSSGAVDEDPPLYPYRIDICHLVALKMRNDEMLRGSFHGLNRTYLRNAKMIQSRLEALIIKMKQ